MSYPYYGIHKGYKTGVFMSWDAAREQVEGFPDAKFKGFYSYYDALQYSKTGAKKLPESSDIPGKVKIDGRTVNMREDKYSPVTYVPPHAEGNAGHPDAEQGVLIEVVDLDSVKVLYCKGRHIQLTRTKDLVWG